MKRRILIYLMILMLSLVPQVFGVDGDLVYEGKAVEGTMRTAQGSDVTAANNMTLGDGNIFDIAGNTTINTIASKGIGTRIILQFDGTPQLTHSADLFLPTGANITAAAGDIATFYEYATADWRCENYTRASGAALLGIDTLTFFVDLTNSYIGMGSVTTNTNNQLHLIMNASKDILVDGSTNPRAIDTGTLRFEQKPSIVNTRAITINLDINSMENTHAQVTNIVATDLEAGETVTAYDVNVDRSTSTGGIVRGYEMSIAGTGTAIGHLIHADPGILPISHFSGTFINVEQGWGEDGSFPDLTISFNTDGTDAILFPANADNIFIGMAAVFDEVEVDLVTAAGGAGIKPTFHYSSGGGTPVWTPFTPTDETLGFRQDGVINWSVGDLTGPTWAVSTINTVSKFWIRITRTQASIPTDPVEKTIQVASTSTFEWDEDGDVSVNTVTTSGNIIAGAGFASASYKTIYIPASQMMTTVTNGAAAGTNEYGSNDINVTYFAFDNSTEESVEFERHFPEEWNLGTIKSKFNWTSAAGSTAGDTVEWELACGAFTDGDAIDAALGTGQVISDTLLANGGTDRQMSDATPAITVGGTPVLADMIHCKPSRNVSGTDDMTEDAWLLGVWIQYQEVATAVAGW